MQTPGPLSAEARLQTELAHGDRALSAVAPVLGHMLETTGATMVSDAVVARLRGMLSHLATQFLDLVAEANERHADPERTGKGSPPNPAAVDRVAQALSGDRAILNHLYALAMEGLLTERLEQRAGIDPVLSDLLQDLIGADDDAVAQLGMRTLAAQSRFLQTQRRMQFSLEELPAALFSRVLKRFASTAEADAEPEALAAAIGALRQHYDEGATRIALLTRLLSTMGANRNRALDFDHAGLALFATGLSALTGQPRGLAVLACHERQGARLALSLRAAGLAPTAVERQFLAIEPTRRVPDGLAEIAPERAASLLELDRGAGDTIAP
jgi:hypothetical protein